MAIPWPPRRREAVDSILRAHPKESGRCEDAARGILPHAKKQDDNAAKWRIQPRHSGVLQHLLLSPRVSVGGKRWRHHVFVEAQDHYVDALTSVDGTEKSTYFETHFNYVDCIDDPIKIG